MGDGKDYNLRIHVITIIIGVYNLHYKKRLIDFLLHFQLTLINYAKCIKLLHSYWFQPSDSKASILQSVMAELMTFMHSYLYYTIIVLSVYPEIDL